MKRRGLRAALVLAFAALFSNGGPPAARSQEAPPQASDFSKLSLKISVPKGEVFQSEPIPVTLELSNETGGPVTGHTALDFSLNHVKLFVRQGGGEMSEIKALSPSRERVIVRPREIAPGERHRSRQLLTLKLNEYFPRPGAYEIQAVLHAAGRKGQVRSNAAAVRVLPPEGPARLAFDFIERQPSAPYFFSALEVSDDDATLRMFEEFENSFGDTAYADYASLQLGKFYYFRKEYAKAREKLEKVVGKKGFAFGEEAAGYLSKVKAGAENSRR